MAFWSKKKWLSLKKADQPIIPWDPARVDEADYRLSIGGEVYLSAGTGSNIQQLDENSSFSIAPGQFAFLITEETITLPRNVIGFISVRAKFKFFGLINVSGFHVDPGYQGKLIFAVFNSGPSRINLRRGDQIFSIWLSEVTDAVDKAKIGYETIPSHLVNQIDGQHLTAYQLSDKIEEIKSLANDNKNALVRVNGIVAVVLIVFGIVIAPLARDRLKEFVSAGPTPSIQDEEAPETGSSTQ